jgi:glyoxylase-like metal-dependent hydrolase (beta-lactamase superfamily II)
MDHPQVHRVGPGTYAVTGLGHPGVVRVNAGFVHTPTAVVFVDAGLCVSDGEFLWQAAHQVLPHPKASTLILTHHHSDHVFGMRVFRERGAKVIAHASVQEFLEDDRGRYKAFISQRYLGGAEAGDRVLGDVTLSLPDCLINEDTCLQVDGEEIRLLACPGHVPSELCVYVARSRVLFAGDAVYEGMMPNTRFAGPAERAEWVRHLRRLRALEIGVVIPGHGALCGKQEIDRNIAVLEGLQR